MRLLKWQLELCVIIAVCLILPNRYSPLLEYYLPTTANANQISHIHFEEILAKDTQSVAKIKVVVIFCKAHIACAYVCPRPCLYICIVHTVDVKSRISFVHRHISTRRVNKMLLSVILTRSRKKGYNANMWRGCVYSYGSRIRFST